MIVFCTRENWTIENEDDWRPLWGNGTTPWSNSQVNHTIPFNDEMCEVVIGVASQCMVKVQ